MTRPMYDFPLAALVGQEQLKSAVLLCAVNPSIGGVLIRGDKGSAKSTAARGLADVMAPITRVVGCVYNCAPGEPAESCDVCKGTEKSSETTPVPFVNLPLGASEDRVLGSLDFERALKDGRKAFQPGLLASAHRGILYIDEVNLLPDHLVDVLLDTAAMGVNRVQREGLSMQHAARIALVGTMNQEEGELRPQLLDRFGMMVEVRAPQEPRLRMEVVKRRLSWEADQEAFNRAWQSQQVALRERVLRAQGLLPKVSITDGLLLLISELCCAQGVTSLRADLVMNKAARGLAALHGRTSVEPEDLSRAAMLVLPHRRRSKPFEQPGVDEDELQRFMDRAAASGGAGTEGRRADEGSESGSGADSAGTGRSRRDGGSDGGAGEDSAGIGRSRRDGGSDGRAGKDSAGRSRSRADGGSDGGTETDDGSAGRSRSGDGSRGCSAAGGAGTGDVGADGNGENANGSADGPPSGSGERAPEVFSASTVKPPRRIEVKAGAITGGIVGRRSSVTESRRGHEVRAVRNERPTELAVTATLHHSLLRAGRLDVTREDLHQKVKAGRQANLILFVVDASGSMAALQRMEMVKGTVLSLLRDAYQKRDEVGVIAFRGAEAEVLLSPTRSVELAERQLRDLPTGGRTPLAAALHLALDILQRRSGASRLQPLLILLSDGKANVPLDGNGDAWQQSLNCAYGLAKQGVAALVLDTEAGFVRLGRAGELAKALGAQCLSLHDFNAESLSLTLRGWGK